MVLILWREDGDIWVEWFAIPSLLKSFFCEGKQEDCFLLQLTEDFRPDTLFCLYTGALKSLNKSDCLWL